MGPFPSRFFDSRIRGTYVRKTIRDAVIIITNLCMEYSVVFKGKFTASENSLEAVSKIAN